MISTTAITELSSGKLVDIWNFTEGDVEWNDIAQGLSNECRFGNQCSFYSVAQHSVILSRLVPPHLAKAALLHDAAEAYIGDMPTPLKVNFPEFIKLESRILRAIFNAYDIPFTDYADIQPYDLKLCYTEAQQLLPNASWAMGKDVYDVPIYRSGNNPWLPWTPWVAKRNFTARAKELGIDVDRVHR